MIGGGAVGEGEDGEGDEGFDHLLLACVALWRLVPGSKWISLSSCSGVL